MDKREDLRHRPKKSKPNAASVGQVEAVKARVEAIGGEWHDAVEKSGLSRNVGYTLLRGEGSIGSLRDVEEWLIREEAKKPRRTTSADAPVSEWAKLGEELSKLDRPQFDRMLDGLRQLVSAKQQEAGAILLMFRPNPDRKP